MNPMFIGLARTLITPSAMLIKIYRNYGRCGRKGNLFIAKSFIKALRRRKHNMRFKVKGK